MTAGLEWIVDASGCDPRRLRDPTRVSAVLDRIVDGMRLTVVGHTTHHFPGEGGVTALYLLAESHLTIHTFPETGLATLNVYCCRVRPPLDWQRLLGEALGATSARVRELVRGEAAP